MKNFFTIVTVMILIVPSSVYASLEDLHPFTTLDAEIAIKEYLVRHTLWDKDQIKVNNISVPTNVLLSSSDSYEILPASKSTLIGRTAFSLNVIKNNRIIQTYWIGADIEVWVDVVLTSRSLKDNHLIGEEDIYMGKKDLAELPPGYIRDVKDAIGKRLKRFTMANRPLTADMIEDPPLFKRGDRVFILAESDALKITALGIAAEDGFKGRIAKVINIQSRKEVFGEVIDGGTVKVRWQ